MKKSIFVPFLLVIFVIFASFLFANYSLAQNTMPTKIIGHAWAPNWGWLNFGAGNQIYPTSTVNSTTGAFSGYAWSTNLGWIRMDPTLTGPVAGGNNWGLKATQSGTNWSISGWMRACSAYANPAICSGTEKNINGTEQGGWDGWFKMKDVVYNPSTSAYTGNAWGDLVGGWVNFGASGGTTNTDCPPTINGICNPACATCGGGSGSSFTASCNVSPTNPTTQDTLIWTTSVSGGSGSYTYTWKKDFDGVGPISYVADSPIKTTPNVDDPNMSAGWKYRQVTVTDSVTSQTSTAICTSSVGVDGVNVTGGSCTLTVNYVPPTGAGVTNKVKDDSYTFQSSNSYIKSYSCDEEVNLTSFRNVSSIDSPVEIFWSNCDFGHSNPSNNCYVTMSTNKTVTANFGGVPVITINGGDGVLSNLVSVNRPTSYPVFSNSRMGAKITMSGGSANVKVTSWGGLDTAAASCGSYPSLCIGNGGKCIDSNNPNDFVSMTDGQNLPIKVYFPAKCPGTNNLSVFHRPANNWRIQITPDGGTTKTLQLYFNDPSPSSR